MRAAVVLVAVALAAVSIAADNDNEPERRRKSRATTAVVPMVDFEEQYAIEQERLAIEAAVLIEAERIVAYLEAMRPKIAVDWARWERLHQCEQPDSWYAYGRFGNGLRGGGGLGMSDGAWQMAVTAARARGVELPGHVLDATPEQQMTAAQAFYDAHGWGWACRV